MHIDLFTVCICLNVFIFLEFQCNLEFLSFFVPAPDVYAVIRCEEHTVKTRVFKKDGSPEFNTKVIFYRRRPTIKIYIAVKCVFVCI